MAEVEFSQLGDLQNVSGGELALSFERVLTAQLADCSDRPAVKSPRKITVTMSMTPVVGQEGALADILTEFEVSGKMPVVRTRQISMGLKGARALVYNDRSPENRHQIALPFEQEEQEADA